MNKSIQCKDIPDLPILEFLIKNKGIWCTYAEPSFMPTVQSVMPNGTPEKLQLAKMSKLIKRGLVDGCDCGCRGDFEITQKGIDYYEKAKQK